jgi:hypothetical protein
LIRSEKEKTLLDNFQTESIPFPIPRSVSMSITIRNQFSRSLAEND